MKLEIKHIDTFNFIKGLLDTYHRNTGAACFDEVDDILTQMDKVPATDDEGYIVNVHKDVPLKGQLCLLIDRWIYEQTGQNLSSEGLTLRITQLVEECEQIVNQTKALEYNNPWEQEYVKRFGAPIPDMYTAFLKTWEQDPVDMYREAYEQAKVNQDYDILDWINWCVEYGNHIQQD